MLEQRTACGFCDKGRLWNYYKREWVTCPYCYGTSVAPQDDSDGGVGDRTEGDG